MDPMTVIATAAIGFISPYLAKAGEAAASKMGNEIYQAVKERFARKPAAQEALTDLEQAPADPDLQSVVRVQLKKLLADDETFAAQLQRLLDKAGQTEAGATIIKQMAGDNAKQFGQVFGNVTFGQD